MINTSEPPDGWVVCDRYPEPGQTVLLWQPVTDRFQTGEWVPARIRDRRIRGGRSREVRPSPGYGLAFPVRDRPVNHYATPGDHPVTPSDTNPVARYTPTTNNHPCTCGHSPHQHTTQNGQPICLICTTKNGQGCRGYITDRTPNPTERDAFHAGFTEGAHWWEHSTPGSRTDPASAAEHAHHQWINGDSA